MKHAHLRVCALSWATARQDYSQETALNRRNMAITLTAMARLGVNASNAQERARQLLR
jgi:hypothetical protein